MDRLFPWGLIIAMVVLGGGTLTVGDGGARDGGVIAVVVLTITLAVQVAQRDSDRHADRGVPDQDRGAPDAPKRVDLLNGTPEGGRWP